MAPQQPFATNHPLSEKDKKQAMKMAQEKAKTRKESRRQSGQDRAGAASNRPPSQRLNAGAGCNSNAQTPPQD